MFRFLEIVWSSLKMALAEFRSNKLRTFLSLFGITVGIFCIIGVLATVDSLERNVQNDIKKLGSKTIYVDKWDYSGQMPWWKLINRPSPKYEEALMLKQRSGWSENVAFALQGRTKIEFEDDAVTGVNIYGVTEDYAYIQKLEMDLGRYLQQSDYDNAANGLVIGYNIAEKLFTNPTKAIGKQVRVYGKRATVIGLIKKQGKSLMGGWDFDESMLVSYSFMKTLANERQADPVIMYQGQEKVPMKELLADVQGAMRSIRKLHPTQKDNFSMNDIESFGSFISDIFSGVNASGWAIATLSLVVGMFGVANIMFVTVRERTSQIGLKKALGAKRSSILTEFLLESAFLCIMGGAIGLLLVYILTKIFSSVMGFPITISVGILTLAISICIVVGVLAGIIPAFIAARMNPVVAIRSK
jgi:putative ABC transport system permease protein